MCDVTEEGKSYKAKTRPAKYGRIPTSQVLQCPICQTTRWEEKRLLVKVDEGTFGHNEEEVWGYACTVCGYVALFSNRLEEASS